MRKKTRLIRRVIFKDKKSFFSTNAIFLDKNMINFFSKRTFFVSKQKMFKFILMLKWFKKTQKKDFGTDCSFEIKFHPIFFCTKKGVGVRMGKGKGLKNYYFGRIKNGFCFLTVRNLIPCLFKELERKIILLYPIKAKSYNKLTNEYR